MGHVDPPYFLNYSADYPDLPCSKWLYSTFQKAHKTAMEEYNHILPHLPSPIALNPPFPRFLQNPDMPITKWLHKWELYVNMQTHTPMTISSCPHSPRKLKPLTNARVSYLAIWVHRLEIPPEKKHTFKLAPLFLTNMLTMLRDIEIGMKIYLQIRQ
jgi:hypothetical protein